MTTTTNWLKTAAMTATALALACSGNPDEKTGTAAGAVALTPIGTPFPSPVGIDCHITSAQDSEEDVVMSVNYPSGSPFNFVTVAADGTQTPFSAVSGFTDEVKIATVRDTLGGFAVGDLFVGNGIGGQVVRVSSDGLTVDNPWVILPGEGGLMRGSLHVDKTGAFNGDLIVVTTAGGVWRIDSAQNPTLITNLGIHLEGLTTVPDDPVQYGPWAGKILAGSEQQGLIYSIAPDGTSEGWALGINPEDLDIIPANENFYGVAFGDSVLYGAPASDFAGMVGDVLVTQEVPGTLFHVSWDDVAATFVVEPLVTVTQWEHVTFCGATVVGLCGNGQLDPGEDCDDGNNDDGDTCAADCQNRPPVAQCQDVSVSAGPMCGADASVDAGSFDPDGDLVGCVAEPSPPYGLGMTTVTLTCTDSHGLTSVCTGIVTVADTTPPVFKRDPKDIKTCAKKPKLDRPKAKDNCGPVTVTNDAPGRFPCGTTIVTWTATDAAGNQTTTTQTVVRKCGKGCKKPSHHHDQTCGDEDDHDDHH